MERWTKEYVKILNTTMDFDSKEEVEDFLKSKSGKAMIELEKQATFVESKDDSYEGWYYDSIECWKIPRNPQNIKLLEDFTREKVTRDNLKGDFIFFEVENRDYASFSYVNDDSTEENSEDD